MRVAPEGWQFILAALLICVALAYFRLWIPLAAWGVLTIWVVAFFRDPARPGPRGEGLIIAPADGKVVSEIPIEEPAFLGGPSTRISIFMNVFNVHVNRYPADGTIRYSPKRLCDIFFSLCDFVVLSPLLLVIAALVKAADGGAVFYRQVRVGLHGRPFLICKFRTMVP